jgi:Tfp pilus assembly protein PilO
MKAQMAKLQTTMNENMAKWEAADIARTANMDAEHAAMKSDVEMKHAMIAQMQTMSDQIQQLNDRITALSAQLEAATAKPVKSHKAKPAQ